MIEVFKDVPNYESIYQISNFGRVKSFKSGKERILKLSVNNRGYQNVLLCENGNKKNMKVHTLVAIAFLGFIPNEKDSVIDHKNGNKTDNHLENLQIISQRENIKKHHFDKKGFVGYDWHKQTKKWRSRIYLDNKFVHLGLFEEEKDALKAYEIANQEIEKFENKKQFRKLIKSKI